MNFRIRAVQLAFYVDVQLRDGDGRWLAVADVAGERETGPGPQRTRGARRLAIEPRHTGRVSALGRSTAKRRQPSCALSRSDNR